MESMSGIKIGAVFSLAQLVDKDGGTSDMAAPTDERQEDARNELESTAAMDAGGGNHSNTTADEKQSPVRIDNAFTLAKTFIDSSEDEPSRQTTIRSNERDTDNAAVIVKTELELADDGESRWINTRGVSDYITGNGWNSDNRTLNTGNMDVNYSEMPHVSDAGRDIDDNNFDSRDNSDSDDDFMCDLDLDTNDMDDDEFGPYNDGEDVFPSLTFNESTDSAMSGDTIGSPPILPMENINVLSSVFHDDAIERMAPPVLSPVSQTTDQTLFIKTEPHYGHYGVQRVVVALRNARQRSQRIDPSYVVLTDIGPFITRPTSSYRRLRKCIPKFECSNMCKKMYFRRRLKAGKNVFNVRTMKSEECVKSIQPKLVLLKQSGHEKISDKRLQIISRESPETSKDPQSSELDMFTKVKTKKSRYLPDDFDQLKAENDEIKSIQRQQEVRERLEKKKKETMLRRKIVQEFKSNLSKLREQVRRKRAKNKAWKQLSIAKSLRHEKQPTISSSGRVRKVNTMYDGFAVTNEEFKTLGEIKRIEESERRYKQALKEKEKRKMSEKDAQRLKMTIEQSIREKRAALKKIEIDNPELEENSDRPSTGIRQMKIDFDRFIRGKQAALKKAGLVGNLVIAPTWSPKDPETGLCMDSTNVKRRKLYEEQRAAGLTPSSKSGNSKIRQICTKRETVLKKKKKKDDRFVGAVSTTTEKFKPQTRKRSAPSKDGVLIQNLPSDKNVMQFLQEVKSEPVDEAPSLECGGYTPMEDDMNEDASEFDTTGEGSYAYGFAKSVLKNSLTATVTRSNKHRSPTQSSVPIAVRIEKPKTKTNVKQYTHHQLGAGGVSTQKETNISKSRQVLTSLLNNSSSPVQKSKNIPKSKPPIVHVTDPSVVQTLIKNGKSVAFYTNDKHTYYSIIDSKEQAETNTSTTDKYKIQKLVYQVGIPPSTTSSAVVSSVPANRSNDSSLSSVIPIIPSMTSPSHNTVVKQKFAHTSSSSTATASLSKATVTVPVASLPTIATPSNTSTKSSTGVTMFSLLPTTVSGAPTANPLLRTPGKQFIIMDSLTQQQKFVPIQPCTPAGVPTTSVLYTPSVASVPNVTPDNGKHSSSNPVSLLKQGVSQVTLKPGTQITSVTQTATSSSISKQISTSTPAPNLEKPVVSNNVTKQTQRPVNAALLQPTVKTTPTATIKSPIILLPTKQPQPIAPATAATRSKFYLITVDGKSILVPMRSEDAEMATAFFVKDSGKLVPTPVSMSVSKQVTRPPLTVGSISAISVRKTNVETPSTTSVGLRTANIETPSPTSVGLRTANIETPLTTSAGVRTTKVDIPSTTSTELRTANVETPSTTSAGFQTVKVLTPSAMPLLNAIKPALQSTVTETGMPQIVKIPPSTVKRCVLAGSPQPCWNEIKRSPMDSNLVLKLPEETNKTKTTVTLPMPVSRAAMPEIRKNIRTNTSNLVTKVKLSPSRQTSATASGGVVKPINGSLSSRTSSDLSTGSVSLLSKHKSDLANKRANESGSGNAADDAVEVIKGTYGLGIRRRPSNDEPKRIKVIPVPSRTLDPNMARAQFLNPKTKVIVIGNDTLSEGGVRKTPTNENPAVESSVSKAATDEKPAEEKVPKPFSEATTDREERLRKLKQLFREKQKAVEDLRRNKDSK